MAGCAPQPAPLAAPRASEGGITLVSERIGALPLQDSPFPAGPGVQAVVANCTACHSAGMILTQPKLSPEQWKASVEKMRTTYHAPVADADIPDILAYLGSLPSQTQSGE
jgi:hypothetical protein